MKPQPWPLENGRYSLRPSLQYPQLIAHGYLRRRLAHSRAHNVPLELGRYEKRPLLRHAVRHAW